MKQEAGTSANEFPSWCLGASNIANQNIKTPTDKYNGFKINT